MPLDRRRGIDALLLVAAVGAVSASAPLVLKAAAPALTIALWRTALAATATAPFAARQHAPLGRRERRLVAGAGVVLAAHFATWISSLSYTSVASAVTLVSTQPVWAAFLSRRTVPRRVWFGIAVAMAGVVAVAGVDLSISGRAVFGDALALAGGMLAAVYVTLGAEVRQSVPTATYTTGCYGIAALALLATALVGGVDVVPASAATWGWIVAITIGPQLLGHTLINAVLQRLDAVVVSVSILFEIVGATLLAWWWFGETPPAALYPAAALLAVGVFLVISGSHRLVPATLD
jgi:drug/metabolite transporter (DMT)-like permease